MPKYSKQKDGRYRTSVSTGKFTPDGKPIKKYLSATSIRELEDKVAETRHMVNADALIFDSGTLYGEFSLAWLKTSKKVKSEATRTMYENVLRLTRELDNMPLGNITLFHCQDIINQNINHPRTCEQIKLTLKQIFKAAISQKLMADNPAIGIELPRHIRKEKRAFTEEEKKMLKSADLPLKEKALLHTMYGSGMRSAEIYALVKDDIDYENHTISVTKSLSFNKNNEASVVYPKTNAGIRSVIVSDALICLLREYSDTICHPLLFGDDNGQNMKRYLYRNRFDSIMMRVFGTEHRYRDSGIDITPYTFRHNFCTECFYAGLSLKECQRQMGHSSTKLVLDVYSHCDSKRENTTEKMAKISL